MVLTNPWPAPPTPLNNGTVVPTSAAFRSASRAWSIVSVTDTAAIDCAPGTNRLAVVTPLSVIVIGAVLALVNTPGRLVARSFVGVSVVATAGRQVPPPSSEKVA